MGTTPAHTAMTEAAMTEAAVTEADLDSLFDAARATFKKQKDATKAARGRVRQVSRQRRHKRRREIAETLSKTVPHVTVQGLITSGFIAFGIALAFFVVGSTAAGLTLCTVVAAAWGLAAVLRR
jgi:acyl-CoA reductase-like NAD-dependent aldehyde dehydrogenase